MKFAANQSLILSPLQHPNEGRVPDFAEGDGGGGYGLRTLQTQLRQLSGGPPIEIGNTIAVSPHTIGDSVFSDQPTINGRIAYGLLNNDALIAAHSVQVTAQYGSAGSYGVVDITGFDIGKDIIQLQTRQAANFDALTLVPHPAFNQPGTFETSPINHPGSTTITFPGGAPITLDAVTGQPGNQLTAANFRFV